MHVLIVYAHPDPHSLNRAALEAILRGLGETRHEVSVVDLYREHFHPVLVYGEGVRRRDLKDDPETARYRELLRRADHILFIYPLWWYGPPAVLKGFLDRVLVSGFAYTYKGRVPRGLLKGKSAWVVYTADSPRWYIRLFRRDAEWIIMKRAVLRFCGIRKVRRLMFGGVRYSSERKRKRWLETLYRLARSL
ncbi:MAG: NAD(P)H-dependent oxidoreductase [Alicyclobacillaceae bacterium]|nr:NAD(P)H-dependent oxidoreductase [Alicyclobacillaceae bacterium]